MVGRVEDRGEGGGEGCSGWAEGRGRGMREEEGTSGLVVGGVGGECIRALDGMLITSCKVYYCRLFNVCLGMFLRMCGSEFFLLNCFLLIVRI